MFARPAHIFITHGGSATLVLTRKLSEQITIDGGIVITIVEIDRGRVRVGIDAPKEVKIMRNELIEKTIEGESK